MKAVGTRCQALPAGRRDDASAKADGIWAKLSSRLLGLGSALTSGHGDPVWPFSRSGPLCSNKHLGKGQRGTSSSGGADGVGAPVPGGSARRAHVRGPGTGGWPAAGARPSADTLLSVQKLPHEASPCQTTPGPPHGQQLCASDTRPSPQPPSRSRTLNIYEFYKKKKKKSHKPPIMQVVSQAGRWRR